MSACEHTPRPQGYAAFFDWCETMAKTHKQVRCPACGLWAIWIPKASRSPGSSNTTDGFDGEVDDRAADVRGDSQ